MVGECRGSEILHLLNAMNTGHQGAGTTLHANSAFAVPHRLAALGALAGLDERTIALHASTAFDRIITWNRCRVCGESLEFTGLTCARMRWW